MSTKLTKAELQAELDFQSHRILELVKENDSLTDRLLDKIAVVKELDAEIDGLNRYVDLLQEASEESEVVYTKPAPKPARTKYERWWNFSIELWPPAWGLNYYRFNWQRATSAAREGQIQIGPFGFSWNREPKR